MDVRSDIPLSTGSPMDRPMSQRWWQQRRWRQLVIAGGALLLVIVTAVLLLGPAQRSLRVALNSVTIGTVEQGVYHDFIPLRGAVVPHDTIYLDALEGGRVEKILAQAGDTVAQGQPLVELSNTALELDVLDREGRLVESITQLQAYETQLEQNRVANQKALADIEYDITRLTSALARRQALIERQLISTEARDTVRDELDRAHKLKPMQEESNRRQETLRLKQLPQIEAQLVKLQQDLKITHSKLDNLVVRAPAAGVLTAMDLKIGENRNRGERFAEITPDTGYKLAASVDEYYLGRVHMGQVAEIEVDDKRWPLKVVRVYPQVKSGTFTVDLAFSQATPGDLLPGRSLQGKLSLGSDARGLLMPAGAFLERSGGDWVFVLDDSGKAAYRRRVKIGRRNAEQVEILSGLAAGERVITSDYTGYERFDRIDLKK
uniref:ABC transporter permease n=1 Tax=uncultured bacterium BLR8 TaxID=506524 RepID=C0IN97_9BACT|nr:ABC transporter permease [uncultured bacterium BLR8]